MEDVNKIVLAVLAIVSVASAVPEYHRVEVRYGPNTSAIQDIMIDEEEQYSTIALTNTTGKVTPSVNLHDFAAGFTAIKDVNKGRCFIKEAAHSMLEIKNKLDQAVKNGGYYVANEYFTCMSEEAVPKSELHRFGERISAFCEHYQAIFTETEHSKRSKRSLVMSTEFSLGCFLCAGFC